MSSVVCGRPCPYNGGTFCRKSFVFMNQLGQCNEHWGKAGQPIMMREFYPENVSNNLKTASDNIDKNVENDEIKEEKSENGAEIGEESPTYDKENGGEPKDDTE